MKQFSLGEYLKDPSRKVITRDGRPVRIICTDRKGSGNHPVVALYPNLQKTSNEIIASFCANGEFTMGTESDYDLFFAPEKHEGWVNVYHDLEHNEMYCGKIYASEEDAKCADYAYTVATIKIEWEE